MTGERKIINNFGNIENIPHSLGHMHFHNIRFRKEQDITCKEMNEKNKTNKKTFARICLSKETHVLVFLRIVWRNNLRVYELKPKRRLKRNLTALKFQLPRVLFFFFILCIKNVFTHSIVHVRITLCEHSIIVNSDVNSCASISDLLILFKQFCLSTYTFSFSQNGDTATKRFNFFLNRHATNERISKERNMYIVMFRSHPS